MATTSSRLLAGCLVAACLTARILADPATPTHDDSFSKEGLFKADVSTLKDTQLIAHPDVPLVPGQNVLWCGTLQLVWNKAIDLVGEKLHFTTNPPVVDLLNRQNFTGADLSADSYVAIADFERNNVEDEIRAALEQTFHGAASPELIPPKPVHPGPDDFVAYAYLYKNLAFEHPFEDNKPMDFDPVYFQDGAGDHKSLQFVESFGFMGPRKSLPLSVLMQLAIYDYKSPDDFILKLRTKSPDDELILAKVAPGATLQETIGTVLKRIASGNPENAGKKDMLAIPKLNFDLRRHFTELEGLILQPSPAAKIRVPLKIDKAEQLVRFQLNEKGAILKSEAVMVMLGAMATPEPEKPHMMIFDKPFLILMKQTTADQPYFALWVGNASLLVPAAAK